MPTAHEHFSEQFEKWEKRGRGWQVFDEPVYPEPPFVPFAFRSMVETPAVDNGVRPSFLGSLFRKIAVPPPPPEVEPEPEQEPEPTPLTHESLVEFQASLPDDLDIARESFDHFFHNLGMCREPVAFELLGTYKRVFAQFVASVEDVSLVRNQLEAHFPDVQFRQKEGALETAWDDSVGDEAFAVDFGLEREFMLPLASGKLDPFIGIVGALAGLQPGELGLFQILWQPLQHPWAESILNSVTHADGKPFFVNSPELAGAAENKTARPLFGVVVRFMARTASPARLTEIARELAGSLRVFANPQGNALIPLNNDDYPHIEHLEDVIARQSRRSGMILNSDELVNFVHLPSSAVRSPALLRDSGRTKAAPAIVHKPSDKEPSGVVIGDNEHNDVTIPVYLTPNQRVRHTHIIGQNGTGKSSLLLNLIRQDIANRDGVAVLDPHGDLIDQILGIIPADRIKDVVLVDLADEDFPIGFNILQAQTKEEQRLLASDLVSIFRRLTASWGPQMDTVLQNAILAILKNSRAGNLPDLRRFLEDAKFRNEILQTVQDLEVIRFWRTSFPKMGATKSVASILARLQEFFSQEPIRNMVSQPVNMLKFADIMDSGKIFLAKLSAGAGGENDSYLLGTLLISKFMQLVMARQAQKIEARRDFWLYIDEFHHFISPSMERILTDTRKYRLGFTLSHQHLRQLQSVPEVASAVMSEPCTRIVLRVGDDDAKRLGECFDSFDAKSLTRLEQFHAIVRVERNDFDFNLALRKPDLTGKSFAQAIIAESHAAYATPRATVEAALKASLLGEVNESEPPEASEPPQRVRSRAPKPVCPPATPANIVTPLPENPPVTELPKPSEAPNEIEVPSNVGSIESNEPKDLGRGKVLHQTIQKRLQGEAHKLGFSAEIDGQLKEGSNEAADVLVKKNDFTIAVEVAVTGSVSHEFENIQKNLKAGIIRIAVVSTSPKQLEYIAGAVQGALGSAEAAKISYHSPDDFIVRLQELSATMPQHPAQALPPGVSISRGRKVTVKYTQLPPEEQRAKDEAINTVMMDAQKAPRKRNKTQSGELK